MAKCCCQFHNRELAPEDSLVQTSRTFGFVENHLSAFGDTASQIVTRSSGQVALAVVDAISLMGPRSHRFFRSRTWGRERIRQ